MVNGSSSCSLLTLHALLNCMSSLTGSRSSSASSLQNSAAAHSPHHESLSRTATAKAYRATIVPRSRSRNSGSPRAPRSLLKKLWTTSPFICRDADCRLASTIRASESILMVTLSFGPLPWRACYCLFFRSSANRRNAADRTFSIRSSAATTERTAWSVSLAAAAARIRQSSAERARSASSP